VVACGVRYVMLDHITMVLSGLRGEDERRGLDFLATRLEMLVKELDFALIMVSHVNDAGQSRGSHLITKVADITISAKRDTLHPDPTERNTVYLTILITDFQVELEKQGAYCLIQIPIHSRKYKMKNYIVVCHAYQVRQSRSAGRNRQKRFKTVIVYRPLVIHLRGTKEKWCDL